MTALPELVSSARNPRPVPSAPVCRGHVLGHLTPRQRTVAQLLVEPLTVPEIAVRLGLCLSMVERHWGNIVDTLDIDARAHNIGRLELARMLWGIDPCWCER